MNHENTITPKALHVALRRLGTLKFFPGSAPESLDVFSEMLTSYCRDDEQLAAVVNRVIRSINEYPGPCALREIVAQNWRELYNPEKEWRPDWEISEDEAA